MLVVDLSEVVWEVVGRDNGCRHGKSCERVLHFENGIKIRILGSN